MEWPVVWHAPVAPQIPSGTFRAWAGGRNGAIDSSAQRAPASDRTVCETKLNRREEPDRLDEVVVLLRDVVAIMAPQTERTLWRNTEDDRHEFPRQVPIFPRQTTLPGFRNRMTDPRRQRAYAQICRDSRRFPGFCNLQDVNQGQFFPETRGRAIWRAASNDHGLESARGGAHRLWR